MKDWKNTEEIIKGKLGKNYPVDDALWQAAEKQLDAVFPIRKKRLGFYIFLGVLGVVSLFASLAWWSHGNELLAEHNNTNQPIENLVSSETNRPTSSSNSNKENVNQTSNEHGTIGTQTSPSKENVPAFAKPVLNGQAGGFTTDKTKNPETVITTRSADTSQQEISNASEVLSNATVTQAPTRVEVGKNIITVFGLSYPGFGSMAKFGSTPAYEAPVTEFSFPKATRFNLETEINTSLLSNSKKGDVGDQPTGLISNTIFSSSDAHVTAGMERGHWGIKLGLGQTVFLDQYKVGQDIQKVRYDTTSSSYQVIDSNFIQNGVPALLIQRRYVYDSTSDVVRRNVYSSTDKIKYWKIPISISYVKRLDHVEFAGQLGLDYLFSPTIKTNFNSSTYPGIDQQRQISLRKSMVRANAVLRLGYRFNYHLLMYSQLRATRSNQNVYSTISKTYRSYDLGFGLNYRF